MDINTLEHLKKQIHSKGFNISALINRFKKEQRERKALYEVPEEVYIAVCEETLKRLEIGKIEKPWPYFMKVLTLKSHEHFANKHQKEAEELSGDKRSRHTPEHIKAIFTRMGS